MKEEIKRFIGKLGGEIFDIEADWYRFNLDWDNTSEEDDDAILGMACMYSYLLGTKPTVGDLADDIEVPRDYIRVPFQRLLQSGVFSKAYNARGDTWLNLLNSKNTDDVDKIRCAWGYIAGISAGAITRNYSNMNVKVID